MNAFRARSLLVMHNGVRFIRSKAFKPPTKKLEKKLEPTDGQIVPSWSFVKPEKKVKKSEEELLQEMFFGKTSTSPTRLDDDVIPVIPGVYLTSKEIVEALERLGCIDIKVVNLKGKMDTIENFIFGTGSSARHIKKMSDVLVRALRSRGLKKAPGFKRAEGEKDDDWVIVDCYNHAAQLMLADTRRALNLEHHWSMETRPSVPFNLREDGPDEEYFEKLLLQYPIPHDYNPGGDADPSLGYIDLDKKLPVTSSSAPLKMTNSTTGATNSSTLPRRSGSRKGRMNSGTDSVKKFRD